MIYLDNAATTKASAIAVESMIKYGSELFYNPSAGYSPALKVKQSLSDSSATIADILGADKGEIIFTSCATESNNAVFECGIKNKKGNVVISLGEHSSVYECANRLKSRGVEVRYAPLGSNGYVTEEALKSVVDSNTALVSIIHCSNETGAVNDIKLLREVVKEIAPRAVFHSDGVQAFCKRPVNLHDLGVDLYSISGHKVNAFKGVGALYVRKGFNMQPHIVGGGQQDNRRSGTENVAGIVGFALAAKEYFDKARTFDAYKLRNIIIDSVSKLPYAKINGTGANSGYVLSISFEGIKGEILTYMAEEKGLLIGRGSACSTHIKGNRVLEAMGVSKKYAEGSIRVSFCPDTTEDEVRKAADIIVQAAEELRRKING